MTLRLLIVLVVLAGAFAVVAVGERRRGAPRLSGLGPGVTVITGPGCRLCAPTVSALLQRGVAATVLDVDELPSSIGPIRSLPTVYVVAEGGAVIMRRSGRSALVDAAAIAAAATPC
jgi:hypothetical protein